jgi:hypothetical protein
MYALSETAWQEPGESHVWPVMCALASDLIVDKVNGKSVMTNALKL